MKLTEKTVGLIQLGDVVTFSGIGSAGNHWTRTGVVYGNDDLGVKCNCEDGSYFGFGLRLVYSGDIDFEILTDHAPVAKYGMTYEFVAWHNKAQR